MSYAVERAVEFWEDYRYRIDWFLGEGGVDLALRFEEAVAGTIDAFQIRRRSGENETFVTRFLMA
jgi:hypothetical protein